MKQSRHEKRIREKIEAIEAEIVVAQQRIKDWNENLFNLERHQDILEELLVDGEGEGEQ